MSQFEAEALTLRTYPYSETNKIVVFLTREFGKLRAVAYGASRSLKNVYGSSLEPLTRVRVAFTRKENQELAVIRSCEILRAFPAFSLTLEQNLHFDYFCELLVEFSREGEDEDKLFRLMTAVLEGVAQARPPDLLARYLELWLLQIEGLLPDLSETYGARLAEKIAQFMRTHPASLSSELLTPEELKRLERTGGELIESHLEKRLKTRKVLNQIL